MEGKTNGDERIRHDQEKEEEEEEARVEVWKYVFGFVDMAVVKCAIELGIADALSSSPMTLSQLSSALGCCPSSLYRIMRFLVHRHFFKQVRCASTQGGAHDITMVGYVQTPISRLFTKNGEKSLAALLMLESSPVMLAPWQCLSKRVINNNCSAFESAHDDKDVWSYAAEDAVHSKLIDDAMACDARLVVPAIVDESPKTLFAEVETVVDVGGGNGTAMGILVKACPWIKKAINFDLPRVVSAAPQRLGVHNVGGDMFHSVPKADAAFLMWVLHDWDDDECIHILRNCREAIPKDKGMVIIVEAVVADDDDDNNHKNIDDEEKSTAGNVDDKLEYVRLMLDMVMMAHTNKGKERTLKEWDYVLNQAGFVRRTVNRIKAVQSVIVAFP